MRFLPPALFYCLLKLVDLVDHALKALYHEHQAQDVDVVCPVATPQKPKLVVTHRQEL
ncbi:hypothetical protein AWB81_07452 [Caballeronia arationis]|nr:hypothetical protein AWB81_07452 [Caballeronia arationis]